MDSKPHSKKISIFVAVLILLIGIIIGGYLVLKSGRSTASQLDAILGGKVFTTETCQPDPSDSNKDSDNDGLKDWQEMQIYKSDPCKTDTDGDGYLDGEEVASGYDPAKKAPEDELPGSYHNSPRPAPIDYLNTNLTELLSKKLSEKIAEGKIPPFDPQDISNADILDSNPTIANALLEIVPGFAQQFFMPAIADSEIKISDKDDLATIKTYLYEMSQLFQKNNDLIVARGVSREDAMSEFETSGDFSQLQHFLDTYKEIFQKMKNIDCPPSFKDFHKEELSFFQTEVNVMHALKNKESDPFKVLLAAQWYQQSVDHAIDLANHLQNQLKNWALKTQHR